MMASLHAFTASACSDVPVAACFSATSVVMLSVSQGCDRFVVRKSLWGMCLAAASKISDVVVAAAVESCMPLQLVKCSSPFNPAQSAFANDQTVRECDAVRGMDKLSLTLLMEWSAIFVENATLVDSISVMARSNKCSPASALVQAGASLFSSKSPIKSPSPVFDAE